MSEEKTIEFKAIIDKLVGNYNNFKIYAVTPIEKNENIKFNQYGNVSISGDLQELVLGSEYNIKGRENKWGYEVINIKRDRPTTKTETKKFLQEVLTIKQCNTLLDVYPNIVDKVIKNDLKDIDFHKLKGIKEKTFEVIKNKIIENFPLVDFIDKFSEYNVTITMVKKMYNKFSSVQRMEEQMKDNPYKTLCSISGVGFKKADSMILNVESNKHLINSIHRIKECIKFNLSENESNGNTWISLDNLIKMCNELAPESMNYFLDGLKSKDIYIDTINKRISHSYIYESEKFIATTLITLLKNSNKWLVDTSKYLQVGGFKLTDEQSKVLKNLCYYNISLLIGNAGSGKSASVEAIINMLDNIGKTYELMTPTGKSSQVLSEYTGKDAGTIHRKLGYNPSEGWEYDEDHKLDVDVVIVDENGMTDVNLMKHLLEAIDIDRTKILFVQDDAQAPSVACGNCAYDLINSGVIPISRLTKIFRYGEGGLLQVATKIREGEKYIDNNCNDIITFGSKEDYCVIPTDDDNIKNYVIGIYKKLLEQNNKPSEIMVLSAKNIHTNGSIDLSLSIQEAINKHTESKSYIKYGETFYRIGDIVMQTKNNYKAHNHFFEEVTITNGDIGEIINIDYNSIYVKYKKNTILYTKDQLDQIQLAYSIGILKSQGSGVKNVILVTPRSHKWNLNKNLLYVGITRAKEKCYHITLPETINSSLRKSIELQRNTFLCELLKESYKNTFTK